MYILLNRKFEIATFLYLAIMLNKPLVGNQQANDSETSEFNLTAELNLNITEIDIKSTDTTTIDNYYLVNTSTYSISNITPEENYTILQDYNETNLYNFSYGENVTYTPEIDETRLPYSLPSQPCNCDLTGGSCDVNCCCDKDCTDLDKDSFYGCIPPPSNINERHCISKTVIYDHMKIKENIVERNDVLCIVQDHLKERNEYLEPPILKTVKEYENFVPDPAYSWISTSEFYDSESRMKAGQPLYIFTTGDKVLTEWKLPSSLFSGHCGAFKTPKYMIDDETTCQQIITDVKEACLYNKWLNSSTYYKDFLFAVSSSFTFSHENVCFETNGTYSFADNELGNQPISKFCIPVSPPHNYTCKDSNGIPQICTWNESITIPEYDAQENICKNVVTRVYYSIVHNGSIGITKASVSFETSTVDVLQRSISQLFSVRYYGTSDAQVFRRSGNPGYLLSHPILAGNIAKAFKSGILLSTDSNNWLTVLGRFPDGSCSKSNNDRISVKFGENLNTGCLHEVTYQKGKVISCSDIQEQVMGILNGFNPPLYVGMFGNSDIHNLGDWIKIQREGEPTKPYSDIASDEGCSNLVLGIDIKIAYANIGSLANPQPKIIGVLYKYLTSEGVQSPCVGSFCSIRITHAIQLKTSVTFIDSSKHAFPMYAQIPVTKISFPHDFFYPLISEYSGSDIGISLMSWPFYVLFLLIIAIFETIV